MEIESFVWEPKRGERVDGSRCRWRVMDLTWTDHQCNYKARESERGIQLCRLHAKIARNLLEAE